MVVMAQRWVADTRKGLGPGTRSTLARFGLLGLSQPAPCMVDPRASFSFDFTGKALCLVGHWVRLLMQPLISLDQRQLISPRCV